MKKVLDFIFVLVYNLLTGEKRGEMGVLPTLTHKIVYERRESYAGS